MAVVGLLVVALAIPAAAQAQGYEPAGVMPDSSEVVLVFISTSTCTGNEKERLGDAIRDAKLSLRERASAEGSTFFAIGAAAEWSVENGLAYLLEGRSSYGTRDFGAWDEVLAGRNWLNSAAIEFILRDEKGRPIVPQAIVFRRRVGRGPDGLEVGEREVLVRAVGSQAILDWSDRGSPIQGAALP